MIIPLYVDKEKDNDLINWLNNKTNRSSYIRVILYEKMKEDTQLQYKNKSDTNEITQPIENNDKYYNSFFK